MALDKRKFLITGVSTVDPFTAVQYIVKDKSKENQIVKNINKQTSTNLYLDGSMLNILRKYLTENQFFTDIYIYLTEEMNLLKDRYTEAIKHLYKDKTVNIKFYPNDFCKESDCKLKLRREDVHKFSSYYKEIYDMYSDIKQNSSEIRPEIVLNISSGTPAFKADMMLMAVTNNLIIEQTANITTDNTEKLRNYAEKINDDKYIIIKEEMLKLKDENLFIDIVSDSRSIRFNDKSIDYLNMLNKLDIVEEYIDSRTQTENINQTKKVLLLESIEDSILKKDYAGIYYSILENAKYLSKNREKLIEISKNLYFRYIGNNEDDYNKTNIEKLKEYYPIFNINFEKNLDNNFQKQLKLNYIIEKFNMMKVKSKREEINDWLLISTPLLEAISKNIASKYSGIDFDKILIENEKREIVISSNRCKELYGNKISPNIRKAVEESNNNFLNEYFYKNILFAIKKDMPFRNREEIEKILDRIYIIDIARADRVDAAHSIKNVNKENFENDYSNRIKEHRRYQNRLKFIINNMNYTNIDTNSKNIYLVENQFKELIKLLLPINFDKNIFEESLCKYETLESQIVEQIEDEIYKEEF